MVFLFVFISEVETSKGDDLVTILSSNFSLYENNFPNRSEWTNKAIVQQKSCHWSHQQPHLTFPWQKQCECDQNTPSLRIATLTNKEDQITMEIP